MNPFLDSSGKLMPFRNGTSTSPRSATSKVMKQIEALEVGEAVNIERFGLTRENVRGCISNRTRKKGYKYKFRFKWDGDDLWALRIE